MTHSSLVYVFTVVPSDTITLKLSVFSIFSSKANATWLLLSVETVYGLASIFLSPLYAPKYFNPLVENVNLQFLLPVPEVSMIIFSGIFKVYVVADSNCLPWGSVKLSSFTPVSPAVKVAVTSMSLFLSSEVNVALMVCAVGVLVPLTS